MDDDHQHSSAWITARVEPGGVLALREAALRQLAGTDPAFDIAVHPLVDRGLLWWRMALQFPGDPRPSERGLYFFAGVDILRNGSAG